MKVRRSFLILSPVGIVALSTHLVLSSSQQVWAQTNPPMSARTARPADPALQPGTFRVEASSATGAQGIVAAPVPVQNLVVFETAMVSRINQVLRDPGLAQRKNVIFSTKAWRQFLDSKFVVFDAATAVVPQQLTRAQLQDLRDSIVRNVDAAVQLELAGKPAMRGLGSAVLHDNVVTGKMTPLSQDMMTAVQASPVQ